MLKPVNHVSFYMKYITSSGYSTTNFTKRRRVLQDDEQWNFSVTVFEIHFVKKAI